MGAESEAQSLKSGEESGNKSCQLSAISRQQEVEDLSERRRIFLCVLC